MALFSKTITGLINGVSRQPYAMRLESQGQEQINAISSVSKGVKRRPGMELVKHYTPPTGLGVTDAWHWIDRSATERYLVHIDAGSTNIRVIDLIAGTVYTPSGADSYISVSGANDNLRFLTIGDVTYIVNTTLEPAMDTARSDNPAPFAFVWVKAAVADAAYKIHLKRTGASAVECSANIAAADKPTTASIATALDDDPTGFNTEAIGSLVVIRPTQLAPVVANVTFTASTKRVARAAGSWETEGVSAGVEIAITGTTSNNTTVTVESVANDGSYFTVRETLVDETAAAGATFTFIPDFTISTSDGWGDQALVAVKSKSKVQSFATLPPTGVDGMIVEVEGDPETSIDSYFVRFEASGSGAKQTTAITGWAAQDVGTGVWEETVKWDTLTTIDPDNMPRKLTFDGSSWTLSQVTWGTRAVGDATTAPEPSFIGVPIQDLAFFKNRLAFISGESVTFSGVGEYESFFPTTVTTLADDDSFDVTANFPDVAKLRFAIPFNEFLVLFAESGIFGVRGSADAGLTPKTVEFLRLTSFTGKPGARPVFAGDRIFFTEEANERIIVREFFPVDAEGTFTVESVSEHVGDYISTHVPGALAADPVTGMLVVVGAAGYPQAWVYQWFLSNREKVQSAWHSWSFTGKLEPNVLSAFCVNAAIIRGDVYFVTYLTGPGGHSKIEVVKVPTDPDVLNGSTRLGSLSDTNHAIPYLDYWQVVTGVNTGGNATFDVSGALGYYYEAGDSYGEGLAALAYGSTGWGSSRGSEITGYTVSAPTNDTTRLTFTGTDYVGRQLLIGLRYYSGYDFSPPVQKNQNVPMLSGRYFARRWKARFTSPVTVKGHRSAGPLDPFDTAHARELTFTQRRVCEFPLHREINETLQTGIRSDHPTQGFELYGVEWEIDWMPRAKPA